MRKSIYLVPPEKRVRLFIDTDANCEADDQYAILHALMTQKAVVKGVIAEHYGAKMPEEMKKSYQEIMKIFMMGGFDPGVVYKGAEAPLQNEETAGEGAGISALIEEAMKEEKRPLFVICQGALTNIASAILKQPEICERMLLVIIGGTNYPVGGYEFNTMNDPAAFNVVMKSKVPCWIIPEEVYSTMQVGMAELVEKVMDRDQIGRYLVQRTLEMASVMCKVVPDYSAQAPFEYALGFPNGESWCLGDSCGIGVLISHNSGQYKEVKAPYVKEDGTYEIKEQVKTVRWYQSINSRFILEDFFAKIEYYFG